MGSKDSFFRKVPVFLIVSGICLLLAFVMGSVLFPSVGKQGRFLAGTIAERWAFSPLIELYGHAWEQVQVKVDHLRKAEEENSKLRLENASLKLGLETLRFECHSQVSSSSTKKSENQLSQETGTRVGRTLASVGYKPPSDLLPSQLYTLGVSYLKAHEDEKAAVIFTSLTSLEDTDTYRNSKDLVLTGVLWYRLENYHLADNYFDEALKSPETRESLPYQAQARLWKAVVSKRFKKEIKTQYWLKELIDHHPNSPEVEWVNPIEGAHGRHSNL